MDEDRLPMMAYVHPEKARRRGSASLRWLHFFETGTKKAKVKDMGWRTVVCDGGQWSKLVHKTTESWWPLSPLNREQTWKKERDLPELKCKCKECIFSHAINKH